MYLQMHVVPVVLAELLVYGTGSTCTAVVLAFTVLIYMDMYTSECIYIYIFRQDFDFTCTYRCMYSCSTGSTC